MLRPSCLPLNYYQLSAHSQLLKRERHPFDIQEIIVRGCWVCLKGGFSCCSKSTFLRQLKPINLISTSWSSNKCSTHTNKCKRHLWDLFGESVGQFAFSVLVINQNLQSVEITNTLLSDTKDQRSLSESDLIYNCYQEFLWDGVAFRGSLWEGKLSSKILFLDF